jgi:Nucleoside H+ symporter
MLLIYSAILVHGIAFMLVSISLQLEVDRLADRRRATAQGILTVATQGVGCFIGAEPAGFAGARLVPSDPSAVTSRGWTLFWAMPATISPAVLVLGVLFLPRDQPK